MSAPPAAPNESQRRLWNNPQFLSGWQDAYERTTRVAMRRLLAAADPRPGERVVDIGCGAGWPTLAAAQAVGDRGRALGVDISGPLIESARGRARETGATNAVFEVVDAQTDAFPGAPYDLAISRNGLMFFEDPSAAFANIRRQLRTGGRLVFTCFREEQSQEWYDLLRSFAPPHDPNDREQMFRLLGFGWFAGSLGNVPATRRLISDAGFGSIHHRSFDYVNRRKPGSTPFGPMLDRLGLAGERREAADAALTALESRQTVNGWVRSVAPALLFEAVAV